LLVAPCGCSLVTVSNPDKEDAVGDSEFRKGANKHESGDVKATPGVTPGVNQLPDGKIALSEAFLRDATADRDDSEIDSEDDS
jgi:hypothetical protein